MARPSCILAHEFGVQGLQPAHVATQLQEVQIKVTEKDASHVASRSDGRLGWWTSELLVKKKKYPKKTKNDFGLIIVLFGWLMVL